MDFFFETSQMELMPRRWIDGDVNRAPISISHGNYIIYGGWAYSPPIEI